MRETENVDVLGEQNCFGHKMLNLNQTGNSLTDVKSCQLFSISQVSESEESIMSINIGGKVFQTLRGTLRKRNVGRLSRLTETGEHYSKKLGQYFFDRDSAFFVEILRFYRTGYLHIPSKLCIKVICEELKFWQLTDEVIGDCCWREYRHKLETREVDVKLNKQFQKLNLRQSSVKCNALRRFLWRVLGDPTSSRVAKTWMLFSILLLITSITCNATLTMPRGKLFLRSSLPRNETDREEYLDSKQFILNIIRVDVACMVVFSLDLLLKIYSAPSRRCFIKSFLFVCDLMHLIPGMMINITILADLFSRRESQLQIILLELSTLTRIFKIIRLAFHSTGMRLLFQALLASLRELVLLGMFVIIGTMFFGFLFYSVEVSSSAKIDNAFHGCWWAIITMSTVGYGDFYPESTLGYVVAALCALSGLILVGMPIPIIANNFQLYSGFRGRLAAECHTVSQPVKVCEKTDLSEGKYTSTSDEV